MHGNMNVKKNYHLVTRVISLAKSGRGVMLSTQFHLGSRLRMSGSITPISRYA